MKVKKSMKKITKLSESPCSQCGCSYECLRKLLRLKNENLSEIVYMVFPNAEFDYHNCPLWISLNAPEMVDKS